MPNYLAIISEIEFVKTLKSISQAYQEISVIRMQHIRNSVLNTRTYMDRLSSDIHDISNSYSSYIKKSFEKNKHEHLTFITLLPKNKKNIALLISSNGSFYYEIFDKVFKEFNSYVESNDCDVMVIGKK